MPMNPSNVAQPPITLQRARMPIAVMMLASLIVGVIALVVIPETREEPPVLHSFAALVPLGTGIVGYVLASSSLKRAVEPVPDAREAALRRLASAGLVGAAIAESGTMILFAGAFVGGFSPVVVLTGGVIGALMIFLAGWPTESRLNDLEARYQRASQSGPNSPATGTGTGRFPF